MRVLTVGNMYAPHSLGGYEVVWQSAVRFLRAHGHDVRVLTTTFKTPEVAAETDASLSEPSVSRELQWYWCDDAWPRLSGVERLRLERENARTLGRHVRDHQPDVVCWWAMGGMSLSMIERVLRQGIPVAFVVCDDWVLYGPEVDGWLRAMRRLPRGAAAAIEQLTGIPTRLDLNDTGPWLFCSETVRNRAMESGWRMVGTEVCHQGVEKALFRPFPTKEWGWRLLYVGRLDPRKGVDLAIEALALMPDEATLTIAGSGSEAYLAELRGTARARGLEERVTFTHHARADLPSVYAEADAVLFPVRWLEPWGLVPLEAMTVGTPVIGTGRGGSGEYLRDDENCLLFDPDAGPEQLTATVGRLARDAGLRARLRDGGFETSRRLPEDAFDRAVESALGRAVERPRRDA